MHDVFFTCWSGSVVDRIDSGHGKSILPVVSTREPPEFRHDDQVGHSTFMSHTIFYDNCTRVPSRTSTCSFFHQMMMTIQRVEPRIEKTTEKCLIMTKWPRDRVVQRRLECSTSVPRLPRIVSRRRVGSRWTSVSRDR